VGFFSVFDFLKPKNPSKRGSPRQFFFRGVFFRIFQENPLFGPELFSIFPVINMGGKNPFFGPFFYWELEPVEPKLFLTPLILAKIGLISGGAGSKNGGFSVKGRLILV